MRGSPHLDADRTIPERVADLLGRLSIDDKIAQLVGLWLSLDPTAEGEVAPYQATFAGAGGSFDPEPWMGRGFGHVTRPYGSAPVDPSDGARSLNALQRRLVEDTEHGIPAIAHEECLTGFMAKGFTGFPSPLNFGSTWDPDLIERVGDTIRRQMRSAGAHLGLAPVADVIRDSRWGRVEECVAEDPYLVGCIVSAYVRGLQGDDLRTGVVATLKHFAGYSSSEGGRNFAPVHVGPRELADVFLVPFEMAIKGGGAQAVMNAYHDIDGEAVTGSHQMLTGVLRDRWGFEGTVVSDYFSISFLQVLHGVVDGTVEAAALALNAGLDVELPNPDCYSTLREAIDRGLVNEATLDRSVERVLTQKFRLGLFEEPYVDPDAVLVDAPADQDLAREVAEKSIVLLRNEGVLPLDPSIKRIAVVGPNSDDPMALFGNYSYQNHVAAHFSDAPGGTEAQTVLQAVRAVARGEVLHAEGCTVMGDDDGGIDDAVALARDCDVALVVVGDKAGHFGLGTVGEGTDTDDLSLPGLQSRLVSEVVATGTPTVVVLVNGRPFALPELAASVPAIVDAWFPGQEGAAAIAGVLFGEINPSGRLTVTFSGGAGQQPRFYNWKNLSRGVPGMSGLEPVFAFGHGLSYTTFEYTDASLLASDVPVDGTIGVSCVVTNTGERAGTEVVQLYLHDEVASVTRPVLELKSFARVELDAGESTRVEFSVPVDLVSFTGLDLRRIVEPGGIEVMLGASSQDIRWRDRVELVGDLRQVGEDRALFSEVSINPGR